MKLHFLGAAQTVTGSCFLLEVGLRRVMIDCGMFQGPRPLRERNYEPFPVSPATVDYVLLTHAHIDHCGLIPKLVKHGFRGNILATEATVDLCEILLADSAHIQEMEVERLNRKRLRAGQPLLEPIYNVEDAAFCMRFFHRVKYNERLQIAPDIAVRFLDAGHILGSAIVEVYVREESREYKLVFTGDLGGTDKPFVNDPAAVEEADFVIMETTYGNRLHKDESDRSEQLCRVLWETYRKGGNLVIPAFAVERTQDLLYEFKLLMACGQFPPMDIYIDSPMAVAITEIFRRYPRYFDEETSVLLEHGEDPLNLPRLKLSRTADESRAINEIKGGAIIISASGMCDAGRIKHHLRHNLWRPECTVLFVGYQAPGTKGRRILDGAKTVRIHGEEVAVKADIRYIEGFSAHADQRGLLNWLAQFKKAPQRVFLVHGESDAIAFMSQLIKEDLGLEPFMPGWREAVDLTLPAVSAIRRTDIERLYRQVQAEIEALLQRLPAEGPYEDILRRLEDLRQAAQSLSALAAAK